MKKIINLLLLLLITSTAYAGEPEIARLKANGMSLGLANEVDDIYISEGEGGDLGASSTFTTLTGTATNSYLQVNTSDAADNKRISLNGGGASEDVSRGAYFSVGGNESVTTGQIRLSAGNVAGGDIRFSTGADLLRWSIDRTSGNLTQDGTNGGNILIGKDFFLAASTADGADSLRLTLSGGGAPANGNGGRGSAIFLDGNEDASAGDMFLATGDAANASVFVDLNHTGSTFTIRNTSDSNIINMNNSGQITSAATSDLGWSAVNAANQACNTTCTSACVFGMNTGALGNFVGCADATADTCICAGSS